jgi:hypothetical protein
MTVEAAIRVLTEYEADELMPAGREVMTQVHALRFFRVSGASTAERP